MIIICPCGEKKFEVDENLIPDKGRLLKCGSCDQTWFFNKNVSVQTKPLIDKPANQKKIFYKDQNTDKSVFKAPIKPGSELVKYNPRKKINNFDPKNLKNNIIIIKEFKR